VENRLDSWKAIAVYLGRDVRTVQRWAKARRLPVHRFPGGERPRIYALKAEIDAWLRAAELAPVARDVSVAVLPFQNLAGDAESGLFADGLADDLINELVRIPGLRVIARTSSFAAVERGRDVREIGKRLGCTWLVEASVRRDRERVRVSAQLVNTRDGGHAWSERYDRELRDIFGIQDEVARSIALVLRFTLTPQRVTAAPADLVAYDLWAKGRALSQQFTLEAFREACDCYEAAIARDPRFARPYFGLADLLFYAAEFGVTEETGAFARAREAIVTSLELDGHFGEAHALLGVFLGLLDHDWRGAERAFRRAFELSPGSASVLSRHAWYHLVPRMQLVAAVDEAQQAVMLDPLSPWAHAHLGLVLVAARQGGRACDACGRGVQLAPGLWWLHWLYATALLAAGRVDESFHEAWQVYERVRQPIVVGAMSCVCGLVSRRAKALELLAELEALAQNSSVPPIAFALAYLGLGDDRVFEFLERAIAARSPIATHLPSMPLFDSLRGDPRFAELLAKMGLA
jgi:TolB-like protein/Flp pilus assembly protein TadD